MVDFMSVTYWPAAGAEFKAGETVIIVVSGATNEFVMLMTLTKSVPNVGDEASEQTAVAPIKGKSSSFL